jgi:hypothetical protein
MVEPGGMLQTVFPAPSVPEPAPPQQSSSFVQSSPMTRQPLSGWQMKIPVGPYGSQSRLQHPPQPLQSMPSTWPQLAGVAGGAPQVPSVAPAALSQMRVQHSVSFVHASPGWVQYDAPARQIFDVDPVG